MNVDHKLIVTTGNPKTCANQSVNYIYCAR